MSEIRTIAVIGAGNMGSGIAQKYAAEGFRVMLLDLDEAAVERGRNRIRETLREAVERKIYREDAARAIEERVLATVDWVQLSQADLVVEAVFEDLAVKQDIFRRLGEATRADAILGTNTSSFRVRELSAVTKHPERVVGLHYFYHPAKNRLVEVVRAPETSDDTYARAWAVQEQIGKTPIATADAPGFVVNRFFVPWINEAARLLEEGVADIPTIEQAAIETFKIALGPFQLMNITGIPIGYHAAATLARELGPFYAPSDVIKRKMEAGGEFSLAGDAVKAKFPLVAERLLAVTFYVAAQLVSEGVGTIEDVDIGARVGLRWARGPFEMMNRVGVAEAMRHSGLIETKYSLPTPVVLRDQSAASLPFPIRVVKLEVVPMSDSGNRDISDGQSAVANITVNRPDALNALNPEVARQLSVALESAIADPKVKGIVLSGAGKAFIAGADLAFFVRNIGAGKFDEIAQFARDGHAILQRIESCPKPVIAKMDGLALGGGLELALACDAIVCTEKASMAFPETGIGIYPGLGGTQRPSRRIGLALTRWLVDTGQMVDAPTALRMGLVDAVVPHRDLDAAIETAIARGKASRQGAAVHALAPGVASDPTLLGMARLFAEASIEDLVAPNDDAATAKLRSRLQAKAPLALKRADALVVEGARVSLAEALELEAAGLDEIFRSADAREGMTAVMERRAAKFSGV